MIEGIREARQRLTPARLGMGWGFSQANINRRAKDSEGNVRLGLNPYGEVDRRIGLIRIEDHEGNPIVLIANYPVHGTVLGGENSLISGDAPGIVAEYVEQEAGAPMLFINGAAGNLAPIYTSYPNPRAGHLEQFKVLLGDRILRANSSISDYSSEVTLQLGEQIIETPAREGVKWPPDLERYNSSINGGDILVRLPVRFLKINEDIASL